jgi:naphthalene 1,2-dioxygenase ferredoxin component
MAEPSSDIVCLLHQGKFDLRRGAPSCERAAEALTTYPVRIDSGRIWVSLR